MRKCLIFSLIFFAKFALSQVNDNFDDGNFVSNPLWTGSNSSSDFTVLNHQLRSNSTTANSSFYLSTPNTLVNACTWEFYCNLQFATSGSNYVDVYLISDQQNLQAPNINGYFVRIGNTADDICLYKRSGTSGTSTKLIDGMDGSISSTTNNRIKIKVSRSIANVFTLERDVNNQVSSWFVEGSAPDATFLTSAYFGFLIQQSTASFFQKHFFDDVEVQRLVTDITPPTVLKATVITSRTVEIEFDEEVDKESAGIPTHYVLNNGYGSPASVATSSQPNCFILTFPEDLITANYKVTVSNVADKAGNIIGANNVFSFNYVAPYSASKGDVIINEIFADPSPQVDLPTVEFLEIRNTTPVPISLKNWKLSDPSSSATLGDVLIMPDEYIVLCAKADTVEYKKYGKVLGVSPWPSLNNSGDFISLRNEKGVSIDSVEYKDSWYKDPEKKTGGWSLELVNPKAVCRGIQNWTASTDSSGGTPGKKNSAKEITTSALVLESAFVVDSVTVRVQFNRSVDSLSACIPGNYVLNDPPGVPAQAKPLAPDFNRVDLIFSNLLLQDKTYQLSVSKLSDCAGILIKPGNNTASFDYVAPYFAGKGDVVINEVFADPSPPVGLPEGEFVELYNTTTKPVSLQNWKLSDAASSASLPPVTIPANGYLILCAKADTAEFKQYGKVLGISPWPSLNNSGDAITLVNDKGLTIDSLSYRDTWYKNAEKKSGGWTLEQVNVKAICKGIQNWAASVDTVGGTPGRKNSISETSAPTEPLLVQQAVLADSITLVIEFNRSVDSLSASIPANFRLNNEMGTPLLAKPLYPNFTSVELKFEQSIGRGKVYNVTVVDITDCAGIIIHDGNNSATFTCPDKIGKGEVLISEILFNPRPEGVDFVEIYNNSDKEFDLRDLSIATTKGADSLVSIKPLSTRQIPFKPHSYLALTTDPGNIEKEYAVFNPETLFKMTSLPPFNDDLGKVVLLCNGDRMDQFSYSEKMHFPLIKNAEGVSLERVSFTRPADEAGNFRSAAATAGFATPGDKNSQYLEIATGDQEVSLLSKTFSPDNDGFEDALTLVYHFGEAGLVANVSIFNDKGLLIRKLYRNATLATEGALIWDGMDDRAARASVGIYILYLEVFDLSGKVKRYKKSCVLASKL